MKVLYVEDHEAQRDIMVQMLELYGYDVAVASDGEEGVKKAQEWQPDVVLMDVRMPGRIDGLVAVRQLRDGSDTADIPIIVISAKREQVKRIWRASYKKNLYALEEGKAFYGPGEVPLSLSNEIDLVREEIDILSEGLAKME